MSSTWEQSAWIYNFINPSETKRSTFYFVNNFNNSTKSIVNGLQVSLTEMDAFILVKMKKMYEILLLKFLKVVIIYDYFIILNLKQEQERYLLLILRIIVQNIVFVILIILSKIFFLFLIIIHCLLINIIVTLNSRNLLKFMLVIFLRKKNFLKLILLKIVLLMKNLFHQHEILLIIMQIILKMFLK